jgi:hypothetical protein
MPLTKISPATPATPAPFLNSAPYPNDFKVFQKANAERSPNPNSEYMKLKLLNCGLSLLTLVAAIIGATASARSRDQKPNIVCTVAGKRDHA